ncbi:glycoside hydrolase family 1 protein [Parathielavia hyrcaniae]|uniref:Glycoside hydrolase family 1 protein n=1 Tax=Parathielavia hyrcaniae TaxID=113614 RepID=A0AAN6PV74_9PEZI|nr:glycoside hydrolase family 1 protein [Parathielavia hyrcaniae]
MAQEASMFSAADVAVTYSQSTGHDLPVEELRLPADLAWGVATAAYQIEGGAAQDGKGKSVWDTYSHLEPSRTNGQHADVACDHYNRMPEDVELIASLGAEVYRFSISWARVIPLGGRDDPVNEAGLAFYSDLIDRLVARGIEPVVTLYHWDTPQALYDRYGGPLDTAEFRADFASYARLCFDRFGGPNRVRRWVTFNEPYITSIFAHLNGTLAPGHCREANTDTKTEPWRVGHSLLLAHADAVLLYARDFQPANGGDVSIVLNGHFYEPFNAADPADVAAAERRMVFYIGWFADPVFLGSDYPAEMRAYLGARLPQFTAEDRDILRRAAPLNGFYGMNHYSTKYARQLKTPAADDDWTSNIEELSVDSEGREIGPSSAMGWLRVAPEGFRKLLCWVWRRYRVPIIITENGCPCVGEDDVATAVDDTFRRRYLGVYLDAISRAIHEDEVVVKGYYVWSLMDNYEWSAGYGPRYGIVHVDFKTLKRTPKNSAFYLRDTFKRRRGVSS